MTKMVLDMQWRFQSKWRVASHGQGAKRSLSRKKFMWKTFFFLNTYMFLLRNMFNYSSLLWRAWYMGNIAFLLNSLHTVQWIWYVIILFVQSNWCRQVNGIIYNLEKYRPHQSWSWMHLPYAWFTTPSTRISDALERCSQSAVFSGECSGNM